MKPPKRLRVVVGKDGEAILDECYPWDVSEWARNRPEQAPFTEHFYTLEEKKKLTPEQLDLYSKMNKEFSEMVKSLEPKKEMTDKDAWIAMVNGECVRSAMNIFSINKEKLVMYWEKTGSWLLASSIGCGPYSIVPDPSKPAQKLSEYDSDRLATISAFSLPRLSDERDHLIKFIEKHFQRKGEK